MFKNALKTSVLTTALFLTATGLGDSTSTKIGDYTWWYQIENDGAWISNYSTRSGSTTAISPNPHGAITIPNALGGYSVVGIGGFAFRLCTNMTAVTLPTTVTWISERAFSQCTSLSTIDIPDSVKNISYYAFSQCTSLSAVDIPDSVTYLDQGAFASCTELKSAKLPRNLSQIRSSLFGSCSKLETVLFPTNLSEIGESAFRYCSNLRKIELPDRQISISYYAFANSGLIELELPENVGLGSYAFATNSTLQSVVLPKTIRFAYDTAFDGCTTIRDVTMPSFANTYYYESGTRKSGLRNSSILFASLRDNIQNITIHEGETSIGADAFAGFTSLTNIVLPSTVTSIGACAFSNCTSLAQITIPKNVMTIDATAFVGCTALRRVTFEGDAPDIVGDGLFFGTSKRLEVRVPRGSVGWGEGVTSEIPATWSGRVVVFSDETYDWHEETAVNDFKVTFVSTNIVVHYVFNSVQPEFAIPAANDMGFQNIITEVKSGGAVSIPITWAMNYPTFTTKFGSDFTKALMKPTGKFDCSGNPMYVWQDYVAGTDPTDEDDVFSASITIVGDKPVISYTPELDDARKALRKYTVYGKVDLADEEWDEITEADYADYHFFRVTVEMK